MTRSLCLVEKANVKERSDTCVRNQFVIIFDLFNIEIILNNLRR